ncbi:MAG: 1-acyl-sn-glycerol-3-phosphate acyltransferase [Phycisphaerales bacterium]
MIYRIARLLWRAALLVFFRRIEVEGVEHVPPSGPLMLVPNHPNAMVDPLVVLIHLDRPVTITAKSTFANMTILRPFMRALHVVTFHRAQDKGEGVKTMGNRATLAVCRERLAEGAALCIFPEGQSHTDARLRPFKHGAASIAVDYVRRDGNPGRLQVVPVGLAFEEKDQWRSSVVVRFGEPIDVEAWLDAHPESKAREFTTEIERRVEALTLNAERRRQVFALTWAAEVLQRATPHESYAERLALTQTLRDGYERLREARGEELSALGRAIRAYRSKLRRLGVLPGEVFVPITLGRAISFTARQLPVLLIGSPIYLWGWLNHLPAYLVVRAIARRRAQAKDQWASWTVYPGLFVFPICYALQVAAAWLLLSWPLALAYTVTLPLSGWFAVAFGDRVTEVWRRVRTFLRFALHRELQKSLTLEADGITREVERLSADLAPAPAA